MINSKKNRNFAPKKMQNSAAFGIKNIYFVHCLGIYYEKISFNLLDITNIRIWY